MHLWFCYRFRRNERKKKKKILSVLLALEMAQKEDERNEWKKNFVEKFML